MVKSLTKYALLTALLALGAGAFAAEPLVRISADDIDYDYYNRAANIDQTYVNDGMIETWSPDTEFRGVTSRVVLFKDGSDINPTNLVMLLNGGLYFVEAELSAVELPIRMARRWQADGERQPGIYMYVTGMRTDRNDLVPYAVNVAIRVATTDGTVLEELEYFEDFQ